MSAAQTSAQLIAHADLIHSLCAQLRESPPALPPLTSTQFNELIRLADSHGVAPLLYYRWQQSGALSRLPPAVGAQLQSLYYQSLSQNGNILQQLAQVQKILGATLSPIVLKGVALAATVYPHFATRPTGDLDLLVSPQAYRAALTALIRAGYQPADYSAQWTYDSIRKAGDKAVGTIGQHLRLRSPRAGDSHLELHWTLVGAAHDWRAPDVDWFLRQSQWFEANHVRARTLNPTAQLLYLCAHLLLSHGGSQARLIWLYDIHLLAQRRHQMNWEELTWAARKFEWAAAVVKALQWAHQFWGTEVAADQLEALQSVSTMRAQHLIVSRARQGRNRWTQFANAMAPLALQARPRIMWQLLLPPRSFMRQRYPWCPAWLWPLAYLYRWGLALKDFLAAIIRLG